MADRVAIAGERKSETKSEEKEGASSEETLDVHVARGRTRSEFRYGKFSRVIPLPVRIQNTNVTADYKDGILNLTLPKGYVTKKCIRYNKKIIKIRGLDIKMTVWIAVKCPCCQSTDIVKNGKSKQGKQRYRCQNKQCVRSSFILNYTNYGYQPKVKQKISEMVTNGSGVRDTARVLGISASTVMSELKKNNH